MPENSQETTNTPLSTSDIELRSEQVQEILTKIPHWMIRWGNLLILIILLLVLLFSYFIKYPDVNSAIEHTISMAGPNDLVLVCGSIFVVGEVDREKWSQ